MFNRTIRLLSAGVKPVYVFDGKPPQMKGGELAKRMARRAEAEAGVCVCVCVCVFMCLCACVCMLHEC